MESKATVPVEVELLAFGGGEVRTVDVPLKEFREAASVEPWRQLELAFHYGQNDFQPKPMPSVSVGDVVRLAGLRYRVNPVGFERVY